MALTWYDSAWKEMIDFLTMGIYFRGNWNLFVEAVNSESLGVIYDIDGILGNLPKLVFDDFNSRNNTNVHPKDIDDWGYLTNQSIKLGLDREVVLNAEKGWYHPPHMINSRRYLGAGLLFRKTVQIAGADNNFLLTSRPPDFTEITKDWASQKFPKLQAENLLIRSDDKCDPVQFKVDEIATRAKNYDWVIFVEDAMKYVSGVLDANIKNCLVINVPLGMTTPCDDRSNLVVIKRSPDDTQNMLPVWRYMKSALNHSPIGA